MNQRSTSTTAITSVWSAVVYYKMMRWCAVNDFSEYFDNTIMNKTIVRKSLGYEFIEKDLRGAIIKGMHKIFEIHTCLSSFRLPEITIVMHPDLFTKLHIIEYYNERLFFYEWLTRNLRVLQIIQDLRMNMNIFRIEYGIEFYDIVLKQEFKEVVCRD